MNRSVAGRRNSFDPIPASHPIEGGAARMTISSAISDQVGEAALGAPKISNGLGSAEFQDQQTRAHHGGSASRLFLGFPTRHKDLSCRHYPEFGARKPFS
jgi:hypothetical protein